MIEIVYPEIGEIFGKWAVNGYPILLNNKNWVSYIRIPCVCKCGTTRNVLYSRLQNGKSKSCGNTSCSLLDFIQNNEFLDNGILFKVHSSKLFAASKCGKILGRSGKVLIGRSQGRYLIVAYSVHIDGKLKYRNKYVHRLVAETWIENPQEKEYVNHKDGNKLNNSVDNLEWATPLENTQHAIEFGLSWNLPSQGQCGFRKKYSV